MRLLISTNSNTNIILPVILGVFLFMVCTIFISVPLPGAYAQEKCPSKLAGIIYTFSTHNLLLDSTGGYQMNIPLNWDSAVIDEQRTFYPCEKPKVKVILAEFTGIDSSLSTEQLASSHIERYAKNIDGYRVIGSNYIDGTQDYSVVAAVGDSESPTIWHGFIPIAGRTGPELFVVTFSAGSPDSYEKYGGIARFIFENIKTVTESQANQYLSMIRDHNQFMGKALTGIEETRQKALDNAINTLQKGTEFDRKMNEENEKYQREREQGLRP